MAFRGKILAIDDELNIRRLLTNELQQEGFTVRTAETGEEGLQLAAQESFDLALVDLRLPGMGGLDVIKHMKRMHSAPETIVITGYGDIKVAVESMKLGARDFLTKPFKLSELIPLADQVVKLKRTRDQGDLSPASEPCDGEDAVVCASQAMKDVYQLIEKVARTDGTVLVLGETGVGKDVIACEIHRRSRRKLKPYVVVDCSLLTENLAESELYGHRKGAFSGASSNKTGLVAVADGGTLFLDEIGNIDLDIQKKLLRFLETKRYRRVGDVAENPVDVRIILATNRPLADAARNGTFRSDLLYRMDVICIQIPPLRDRPEDIPVLVDHFLKANEGLTENPVQMSAQSMDLLKQYPWPGNVRELRSVIFKTLVLASSTVIGPDDLPYLIGSRKPPTEKLEKSLSEVERNHIIHILHEVRGNQSRAAEVLGINRRTLYNKLHKHEILT